VAEALRRHGDWNVQQPIRFRHWKRRGWPCAGLSDEQRNCLIRCDPTDGMNGFFVALLVKNSSVSSTSPPPVPCPCPCPEPESRTGVVVRTDHISLHEEEIVRKVRKRPRHNKTRSWWEPWSKKRFAPW